MSFVPVTVYVPPPPSPLAQELGRQIAVLIDQYSRENPGLTTAEINQALQLAARRSGTSKATTVILAVLVGLTVLGLLFFIYFLRAGSGSGTGL